MANDTCEEACGSALGGFSSRFLPLAMSPPVINALKPACDAAHRAIQRANAARSVWAAEARCPRWRALPRPERAQQEGGPKAPARSAAEFREDGAQKSAAGPPTRQAAQNSPAGRNESAASRSQPRPRRRHKLQITSIGRGRYRAVANQRHHPWSGK